MKIFSLKVLKNPIVKTEQIQNYPLIYYIDTRAGVAVYLKCISRNRIDMHILGLEAVCVKTDNNTCKILPGTCYCALSSKTESLRLIEESYSNSILCVNKVIILMGILIQMFWNEVTQKYIVFVLNCSFTINKRANTNYRT